MRPKCRSVAAVLFAIGCLAIGARASDRSLTKEQVELFRGFYQGSIDSFFEVVGHDLLGLPMGEFGALPRETKRPACLAIVDHMTFRSWMSTNFLATHGRQSTIEFMRRAKDSGGFLFKDLKGRFEALSEKSKHCLLAGVVRVESIGFTKDYADTPTEFRLRELYQSQLPFIRWVWDGAPASRERDEMAVILRSMERKYLLNVAGPKSVLRLPSEFRVRYGIGRSGR